MDEEEPTSGGTLETFLEDMKRDVLAWERAAKATGNPLYAWLALSALWAARVVPETAGHPRTEEPFCIPAWCADVIGPAAEALHLVASDYDLRQRRAGVPIPAQEAIAQVPIALGFTRQGFNAFKTLRSDVLDDRFGREFDRLRAEGMTYDQAWKAISDRRGREASGTRKRATKARRLKQGQ
jgi:hypothetical protein